MTTATLPKPQTQSTERHFRWVGNTRMVCIQQNCDGKHHFFCSCRGR